MKEFHLNYDGKNARLRLAAPAKKEETTQKTNSDGEPIESITIAAKINPKVSASVGELAKKDPEVDLESLGRYTEGATRAHLDDTGLVQGDFSETVVQYDTQGQEKQRKPFQIRPANINHDVHAVEVVQEVPRSAFLNKYVVTRTYQLAHDDGVKFAFLFDLAKHLHEKNAVGLLAFGPKKQTLIFQDRGKPYRCAIAGLVEGDTYKLLLLVLGQELKLPEDPAPSK